MLQQHNILKYNATARAVPSSEKMGGSYPCHIRDRLHITYICVPVKKGEIMMFTKLKNAFLGRNRVSKKVQKEIANYLVVEYKINRAEAEELARTGEYKNIVETCKL